MATSPIRVAIIGLGSTISPTYRVGEWGIQHLRAITASPYYTLTAVCNSTVASAEKSIAFHKLDTSAVKAYGNAEDVAADPNVDLAVIAVHVDSHLKLAKPIIEAGKDIFVEFPLAKNFAEVSEVHELAQKKGVKAIVGLQAYTSPAVAKLRELVKSGVIGDVMSTNFTGTSQVSVAQGWPENVKMFLDIDGGANRVVILLGHPMGAFVSVVGDFTDMQSVYKTETKQTTLLDSEFKPTGTYDITAPDSIAIQGVLSQGAIGTIHIRNVGSPADDKGFRWIISGTKGEVVFTAGCGVFQMGLPDTKIMLKLKGEEAAQEIDWESSVQKEEKYITELEGPGPNIARIYDAFAKGNTEEYPSFETGLKVHGLMHRATEGAIWAP